jgi:rhodanese-related sulfurtransferase
VKKTLVVLCLALAIPVLATPDLGAAPRLTPAQLAELLAYARIAARAPGITSNPGAYAFTAQAAKEWFQETPFAPTIFADELDMAIQRCDPVFVIDTRDAASYAAGHIPGAVNIPLATLFEPASLARLPTDGTRIVTMCVTGHTGSMAAAVLGTLGYPASTVRFGWLGWKGGTVKVYSAVDPGQAVKGGVTEVLLPVATGSEPGGPSCP